MGRQALGSSLDGILLFMNMNAPPGSSQPDIPNPQQLLTKKRNERQILKGEFGRLRAQMEQYGVPSTTLSGQPVEPSERYNVVTPKVKSEPVQPDDTIIQPFKGLTDAEIDNYKFHEGKIALLQQAIDAIEEEIADIQAKWEDVGKLDVKSPEFIEMIADDGKIDELAFGPLHTLKQQLSVINKNQAILQDKLDAFATEQSARKINKTIEERMKDSAQKKSEREARNLLVNQKIDEAEESYFKDWDNEIRLMEKKREDEKATQPASATASAEEQIRQRREEYKLLRTLRPNPIFKAGEPEIQSVEGGVPESVS